jgi:hypothetical protein
MMKISFSALLLCCLVPLLVDSIPSRKSAPSLASQELQEREKADDTKDGQFFAGWELLKRGKTDGNKDDQIFFEWNRTAGNDSDHASPCYQYVGQGENLDKEMKPCNTYCRRFFPDTKATTVRDHNSRLHLILRNMTSNCRITV